MGPHNHSENRILQYWLEQSLKCKLCVFFSPRLWRWFRQNPANRVKPLACKMKLYSRGKNSITMNSILSRCLWNKSCGKLCCSNKNSTHNVHFPRRYAALTDHRTITEKHNRTIKLWLILVADGKPVEPTGNFGRYPAWMLRVVISTPGRQNNAERSSLGCSEWICPQRIPETTPSVWSSGLQLQCRTGWSGHPLISHVLFINQVYSKPLPFLTGQRYVRYPQRYIVNSVVENPNMNSQWSKTDNPVNPHIGVSGTIDCSKRKKANNKSIK